MWDFKYITWLEFNFSNSGLSLSTWLGDFNIPMRTFILIASAVIVLRVRKRVRDAKKNYSVPPQIDLWN
jgi:hypothetical protein